MSVILTFAMVVTLMPVMPLTANAATENTKIYYTESQGVGSDTSTYYRLRRANISDGSGAETLYWSEFGTPEGVAVDLEAGYVYFSDPAASIGTIYRANLDGSNRIELMTGVYANDISLDIKHGKIYYTESQGVDSDTSTYYRLRRANLSDGSGAETLYWSELGSPHGVAVDPMPVMCIFPIRPLQSERFTGPILTAATRPYL